VPCPTSTRRARDRPGDPLEGRQDPVDALLAIEPPDVQHEQRARVEPAGPARRALVTRREAAGVDAGRHDGDRDLQTACPQLLL